MKSIVGAWLLMVTALVFVVACDSKPERDEWVLGSGARIAAIYGRTCESRSYSIAAFLQRSGLPTALEETSPTGTRLFWAVNPDDRSRAKPLDYQAEGKAGDWRLFEVTFPNNEPSWYVLDFGDGTNAVAYAARC